MRIRFLAVTYTIPVQASGTAIVIRRLLENFSSEEVVLLGRKSAARKQLDTHSLNYRVVQIPIPNGQYRGARYGMMAAVIPAILQGLWAIRQYKLQAIVTFFPDEGALLTGYCLHRLTGLPFLPYFCDLYLEADRPDWQLVLARWLQPRVLEHATKVLVANAGMAEFFREQYQIEAVILPTAINASIVKQDTPPEIQRPLVIGYSGSVTIERLDAMQRLIEAVGNNPRYEIRYFSAQEQSKLESLGVRANNTQLDFARNSDELITKLQECDVLYLPLSFDTNRLDLNQLKTAFGIKAYDYFITQRPILVHAPPGYYTAQFFIDHDCGLVVNTAEASALKQALEELQSNRELRQRLVSNALKIAYEFEGAKVASKMRQVLNDAVLADRIHTTS